MSSKLDIPQTTGERLAAVKEGHELPHPESPIWFNKEHDLAAKKEFLWAAPYDARFPQVRKQRHCFAYYVDFFRCQNLMGDDYEPCKFFQNVYKDFCPGFWVEKWDELREEGRFPAKFDR
uniref:Cytochrome c oxidase subunit n=1 Tax=Rhabditophanes sp. KR3021 TaxID=114890 RepID=A0AC35TJF0_9BILA